MFHPSEPRHILITGAGSGIGAGIARQLASHGHQLLITDLDAEAAGTVAAAIGRAGGQADWFGLDVTSASSVAELVRHLDRPVDVLINNAGLQHVEALESFPMEKWELLIQVMLIGVARLTRELLPGMRGQNFGRIINIGSIHSLVASAYKSAYVAAKHGLIGLSRTLALETADSDITINTVCPTYVKTPLVERQIADQARVHGISEEEVIEKIMLKPMPKGVFISF
ncbi:MAG: 3-hydroxybutyrate dehydrogenase, partial [Wenzhouxiangella sp.]